MAYYDTCTFWTNDGRGRIIQYPPSINDPSSTGLFVECAKHLKMVEVRIAALANLQTTIDNAFWNCPGCVDEREAARSRWPEGAEL